jgi:hypothetical protein
MPLAHLQGELDAYNNCDEQWRVVIKDAEVYVESAATEPDSVLNLPSLAVTAIDADMAVKGGHKRKRGT